MSEMCKAVVGEQVLFCRQDYIGHAARVDEYPVTITAVYPDGRADLRVSYLGTQYNVEAAQYDLSGKPGTWHRKQTAQETAPLPAA